MYCITRKPMKFGQYEIPTGTKGYVIGQPSSHTVNAPGVTLKMYVLLWDIANPTASVSRLMINNKMEEKTFGPTESQMTAIVIDTNTTAVCMGIDEDNGFYSNTNLYNFQVKKIFGDEIPKEINKADYSYNNYTLASIIDYFEDKFNKWIQENCQFITLTVDDIENGEYSGDYEEGDSVLSDAGMQQFEKMKKKYQAKLEVIGFTYDFKGGLTRNS